MLEELTKGLIIGLGEPTVLLYNGTFNASTRYLKQHFPLHSTPVRLNFNRRKIPLPLAA